MSWPINPSRYDVDSPGSEDLFRDIIEKILSLEGELSSTVNASNVPPVPNGSFEIDASGTVTPSGWDYSPLSGGSGVVTNTDSDHGAKSYKATHPGGPSNGGVVLTTTDFMPVSVGQGFQLYLSTRATNANVRLLVQANFYDSSQSLIIGSTTTIINRVGTYPSTWRTLNGAVLPVRTPSAAKFMKIVITLGAVGTDPGSSTDIFIDNVALTFKRRQTRFNSILASTTFTVPQGCTKMIAIVLGAGGGSIALLRGGMGGCSISYLPVFPGQQVSVVVGTGSFLAGGNSSVSITDDITLTVTATGGQPGSVSAIGADGIGSSLLGIGWIGSGYLLNNSLGRGAGKPNAIGADGMVILITEE